MKQSKLILLGLLLPLALQAQESPYYFDGSISREVLERYLDRSVTAGYFLLKGPVERYEFPYREDDIRMVKNIGAKFIGRSIYCWGGESALAVHEEDYRNNFLWYAFDWLHKTDPNGHLQFCLIRMITCKGSERTLRSYFANTNSENCPVGYSQEETIKKIWNTRLAY